MSKISELTLGMKNEDNKHKIYYVFFTIVMLTYIAWAWIGQTSLEAKATVGFYSWLALIAVAFILFDNATTKRFEWLDSVTIEKIPIKLRWILLGTLVITIFFSQRIFATNTAFIPYPTFQVFDNPLQQAFLSGALGWVENLFFFAFLFPTIFAIIGTRFLKNFFLTAIAAVFVTSLIFMLFHIFVYGPALEAQFYSSFVFALICCSTVTLTRTTIVADALHMSNNIVASYLAAHVAFLFF